MKKTYIRVKGQSKYASKWNVGVYDENENYTCKGFATKEEAENYINDLKSKNYQKQDSIVSW